MVPLSNTSPPMATQEGLVREWSSLGLSGHSIVILRRWLASAKSAPVVNGGGDDGQLLLDGAHELAAELRGQEVCADVGAARIRRVGPEEAHLVVARRLCHMMDAVSVMKC